MNVCDCVCAVVQSMVNVCVVGTIVTTLSLSGHVFIPQVGNAALCTKASRLMEHSHGIYIQDINYPTVKKGEEMLRLVVTPHHTDDMKRHFVESVVSVWKELGLPFTAPATPPEACHKLALDLEGARFPASFADQAAMVPVAAAMKAY